MPDELLERELKYEVDDRFAVPDLRGLVTDGDVELGRQSLESVYFDTETRDLLACGVTLRCRGGTTDRGWQLKIPTGDARTEVRLDPTDLDAGARRSGSANKVARALGEGPVSDADPSSKGAAATAGELIGAYLAEQDHALVMGDLSLRRGLGGIHPTRVAARRLRSTLRIFADYLDSDAARALDAELAWYADLLGQVRDREVQRARFAAVVADLPAELVLGPVAATIEHQLLTEQLRHAKTLRKAMSGHRYLTLLREVQRSVTDPPFTDLAADEATALRTAVRSAEKKVGKHLAAALAGDDDVELHKARKAGKRARYAAELAAPILGGKAKKRIKRYEQLQDILGDHQDGVVAAALLRRLAAATAAHSDENGFTYGLLYAQEQHRAARSRRLARARTL